MIAGPTAVGKTKISIELCRRLDGEILSADSMQIYKYMNIGSAKPTEAEQAGIPHHMMDVVDPAEAFSAADYKAAAEACLEEILSRGKLPIMVGGTGLYFDALLYDRDFSGSAGDGVLREAFEAIARAQGNEALHDMLKEKDAEAAARIHPNNVRRVVRALELIETTGSATPAFDQAPEPNPRYNFILLGLTDHRQALYERIDQRVDAMFEAGLVDEIIILKNLGLSDKFQSMQGIGYKEVFRYLDGLATLEETIALIKQSSRRYAKRQLTWFKRYPTLEWFEVDGLTDPDSVIDQIERAIRQKMSREG
ncbi:tRNA dimethylallyltransferase [Acidaminobacter hydrogenoformans DSM 2784]|uniref:tRNA dimethylallyltransferase n=2 Tax=Acidaminobacter TaxID=65402 RepID=A0A1G5RSK1_9FIRM|nr:tRNA dimethylallyltransferase [Acidaminobacter hydrogenoformans DSM 2784]